MAEMVVELVFHLAGRDSAAQLGLGYCLVVVQVGYFPVVGCFLGVGLMGYFPAAALQSEVTLIHPLEPVEEFHPVFRFRHSAAEHQLEVDHCRHFVEQIHRSARERRTRLKV